MQKKQKNKLSLFHQNTFKKQIASNTEVCLTGVKIFDMTTIQCYSNDLFIKIYKIKQLKKIRSQLGHYSCLVILLLFIIMHVLYLLCMFYVKLQI